MKSKKFAPLPETLTSPIHPLEIQQVQTLLANLLPNGKAKCRGTECVFTIDKVKKEFTVENLPAQPTTVGQMWAFRVFMCLGRLGYQASSVVIGVGPVPPAIRKLIEALKNFGNN